MKGRHNVKIHQAIFRGPVFYGKLESLKRGERIHISGSGGGGRIKKTVKRCSDGRRGSGSAYENPSGTFIPMGWGPGLERSLKSSRQSGGVFLRENGRCYPKLRLGRRATV